MNWIWSIRSRDGAANGLEFARCLTAGGFARVLIHAAPAQASIEVTTDAGDLIARGDVDREGPYTPMTLIELAGDSIRRSEVWPDEQLYGSPVLLPGGEAGILTRWEHAEDRSWWRWSVELSNHKERPGDWSPPR